MASSSDGSTVYDAPRKRREPTATRSYYVDDLQRIRRISRGSRSAGSDSFSSRKAKSVPLTKPPRSKQRDVNSLPPRPMKRAASTASHKISSNSQGSSKASPPKPLSRQSRSSLSRYGAKKSSHLSKLGLPRPPRSRSSFGSVQRTPSKSSAASSRASRRSNDERKTFHVRVSVGYLTGLKVEQMTKKRNIRNSNQIVTGYAEVAKSKNQIVSSQPLVPDIIAESPSKAVKLIWGKSQGAQNSQSTTKDRKLYFSVRMQPGDQSSTALNDDDGSTSSDGTYSPEVVKVAVGVRCGDDKLPLGVANLVVNGAEMSCQKVHLAVRPISEPSDKKISRLGIFGNNKKQSANSFQNGQHRYSLDSNCTLRVTVDVKSATPGVGNERVWGASCEDDESYATYGSTSLDSEQLRNLNSKRFQEKQRKPFYVEDRDDDAAHGGCQVDSFSLDRSFMTDLVEAMPDFSASSIEMAKSLANQLLMSGSNQKSAPMQYIIYRKPDDGRSMASGLTEHENESLIPHRPFLPLACWGQQIARASSFEDELLSDQRAHDFGSGKSRHVTNRKIADSGSPDLPVIRYRSTASRRSRRSGNLDIISKSSTEYGDGATTDEDSTEGETADYTTDTLTDLKDAQETLARYASKVGVDMDDLLGSTNNGRRRTRLEESRE